MGGSLEPGGVVSSFPYKSELCVGMISLYVFFLSLQRIQRQGHVWELPPGAAFHSEGEGAERLAHDG